MPNILCSGVDSDSFQTARTYASMVSFTASLAVILSYALLPNLRRNQNFRYIGYLSVANALISITGILLPKDEDYANPTLSDSIFSCLLNYSGNSLIFWGAILVLNVYNIVTNKSSVWASWVSNEKLCLFIGFILPLGSTAIWVWSEKLGSGSRFNSIYILVLDCCELAAMLCIHINIIVKARKFLHHESAKRLIKQTIGYSIVLTINLITDLSGNIYIEIEQCEPSANLWLSGIWYLEGLLDAIIYGTNPVFWEEVRAVWRRNKKDKKNETLLGLEKTSCTNEE